MTTTTNIDDDLVALQRREFDLRNMISRLSNEQLGFQGDILEFIQNMDEKLKTTTTSTQAYQEASSQVDTNKSQLHELVKEKQRLEAEIQAQIQGRVMDQSEYTQLETRLDALLEVYDALMEKSEVLEERQKSMNCRICSERTVEFALVPCYHLCYCQPCTETLTECAICHEPKKGAQRIYYG
ncbi:hypothetical protein BDA99DRAFT_500553 [Phascolomyces articulosus]|uniref:RING-type domain-containing protein n=1 Tax=Phascolomyces articulosus TaxID=60185 RepID=A0AAD5KMV9_9FUNG|nr:hypothetical protein BDA99DRAFT_500553 [Phascolomyces articulosus]